MGSGRRRRTKQTRLSLAPHNGSVTPNLERLATNEYSQTASVRYGTNLANHVKPRRARDRISQSHTTRNTSQQGTLDMAFARAASRADEAAQMGLPTPDASSQVQKRIQMSDFGSDASSSEDAAVKPKSSKRRRESLTTANMNTTAFFRPAVSSPSNPIPTPKNNESTPAAIPHNSLFGSSPFKNRVASQSESEDEDEDEGALYTESTKKQSSRSLSRLERSSQSNSSRRSLRLQQAKSSPTANRSSGRHSNNRRMVQAPGSGSDENNSDIENGTPGSSHDLPSGSDSANDSEPEVPPPRRRLIRGHQKKSPSTGFSESDDEVRTPAAKRRRERRPRPDDDVSETSDEIVSSSKRQRPRLPSDNESSLSETPKQKYQQEKDDLNEDLEFLRDSSPPPGPSKKLSAREERQMHLERMKAQRAKKSNTQAHRAQDDRDDQDNEVFEEDEDQMTEEEPSYVDLDHKENLDDFIEDDDPDIEPDIDASVEMPLEFSRHAHKSIKEHFTDVVEWMVHNKLNPAFARDDPIYRIAFRKVNDEVQGYALSKFTSSTWRAEFARAMRARPIFNEEVLIDNFRQASCVACGRTSHPATFIVTFTGKAYDPETLENLKDDHDSDDSNDDESSGDDNDGQSVDVEGHVLPPESHQFFVGRVCKRNSSLAHALTHWRWHLSSWIVDWLEQAGYLNAEQVLEREKWSTRRRTKYANRVLDELAATEIRNLWRDFKIQLETAKTQQTYDRYRR